jgi:hypothetical protein
VDGQTYLYYKYLYDRFYFIDNRLEYIELKSNQFYIICKGHNIKVGDDIALLSSVFPDSFLAKKERRILIGLKHSGIITDSFLVISYNDSNRISEIVIQ